VTARVAGAARATGSGAGSTWVPWPGKRPARVARRPPGAWPAPKFRASQPVMVDFCW